MSSDSVRGDDPRDATFQTVEYHLFESLVHHLIEKGVLTKVDALSVVQTAAEVVRGEVHESARAASVEEALGSLERTYFSFEAIPDYYGKAIAEAHNVTPLRAPLHRGQTRFPSDDN